MATVVYWLRYSLVTAGKAVQSRSVAPKFCGGGETKNATPLKGVLPQGICGFKSRPPYRGYRPKGRC